MKARIKRSARETETRQNKKFEQAVKDFRAARVHLFQVSMGLNSSNVAKSLEQCEKTTGVIFSRNWYYSNLKKGSME
jgi:hypothetical protein